MWVKPTGAELAQVTVSAGTLSATGSALGGDPCPYRLGYGLSTSADYLTTRLVVRAEGTAWWRSVEVVRDGDDWRVTADGEGESGLPDPGTDEPAELRGALDCDLEGSPLTNTMPVLRHGMHRGLDAYTRTREFLMAFVSVPSLAVRASRQSYTPVSHERESAVVQYTSGPFTANIAFDAGGFVTRYPGVGTRIDPA